MRSLLLFLLVVLCSVQVDSAQAQSTPRPDRVNIKRQKLTIIRTGQVAKNFPDRRRATITYPVVSGLTDPAILRKVRAILTFKNIFDYSLKEYREDSWLEEFDYVLNYNDNYILDLTFTQVGSAAYPDSQSKNFAINLKTGAVINASDVFVTSKMDELARLVDAKLQAEVAELIKIVKADKTLDDPENVIDALQLLKFEVADLDKFSVGKDGITFLYDAGFPHVIEALQPDGRYLFEYSKLKPFIKQGGPLWQFVK
jgi:hypothetical protein